MIYTADWIVTQDDARTVVENGALRVEGSLVAEVGPAAEVLTGAREAAEGNLIRPLDEYAAAIRASAEMNYARWGVGKNTDEKAGKSFENAVAYLEKWIAERTAFMDGVYGYAEKHE